VQVALYLPSRVPEFQPSTEQLAGLAHQLAPHVLTTAHSETAFLEQLTGSQAAVVWSFDASWYRLAPELRHVFTPSAGREQVAADPSGRCRVHYGTFHGHIMAESLLAMMLFMNRRLGAALEAQSQRQWNRSVYVGTRRLAGQTALLVGYGAIGQHSARLLTSLGVRVHALRRSEHVSEVERTFSPDELLQAVAVADHVVSLLPGDASTAKFFGPQAFSCMKKSAYFYNLGRGSTVDEPALMAALEASSIAGAFLDVTSEEPLPADAPLWRTRNLFLTPHASAISGEYLDLYFAELSALVASLG
jgi:D-2-hydroxyacid dehydrogenase (NADP+)